MRNTLRCTVAAVLSCMFLGLVFSCSGGTTKHEPVEYRLYVCTCKSDIDGQAPIQLFAIDAEDDTIIDSVDFPGPNWVTIAASPDGKCFATGPSRTCVQIYDAASLTVLAELQCSVDPIFLPKDGLILLNNMYSGMSFYDYHTFSLLECDSTALFYSAKGVKSREGLVYGKTHYGEGRTDSTGFMIYDYRKKEVVKSWHRFNRRGGGPYQVMVHFDIHPDGRRLYGAAMTHGYQSHLFCYDLDGDSTIWYDVLDGLRMEYGYPRVSSDGREVYYTDPGYAGFETTVGKIIIYDADKGAHLGEISLWNLDTTGMYPRPLYAYDIRFHPDKPKAYVACGGWTTHGPTLVIDTDKREIVKWIFPEMNRTSVFIDIAPKP